MITITMSNPQPDVPDPDRKGRHIPGRSLTVMLHVVDDIKAITYDIMMMIESLNDATRGHRDDCATTNLHILHMMCDESGTPAAKKAVFEGIQADPETFYRNLVQANLNAPTKNPPLHLFPVSYRFPIDWGLVSKSLGLAHDSAVNTQNQVGVLIQANAPGQGNGQAGFALTDVPTTPCYGLIISGDPNVADPTNAELYNLAMTAVIHT